MMGDIRRLGAQVVTTLTRREKRVALYPANPLPFAMDRLFRVGQGAHLAPTSRGEGKLALNNRISSSVRLNSFDLNQLFKASK